MQKQLSILGSTGSIGCNTLKIIEMFPDKFSVRALAARNNIPLLSEQIRKFNPDIVAVFNEELAEELTSALPADFNPEIVYGIEGYKKAAILESIDMVVTAVVGSAGLIPTLAAIDAGKNIALANKETLVMAGDIVMKMAAEKNVKILPIDSEHSAISQCLEGYRKTDLEKILLTASGGPFLNKSAEEFSLVKPEDALNHPTWAMGEKISIDSATLMNKGLEVIEAKFLFDVPHDMIKVVVHPQSVIHSMVSYIDGSVIAQMGIPDMKGAIAYALSYPERLPLKQPIPDFAELGSLTFENPDLEKFPCLDLAFQACSAGGTMPAVLNAANEIAVHAFLKCHISFDRIPVMIKKTMAQHTVINDASLDEIIEADEWARKFVENLVKSGR
ncbi:MAG: 1-deoxy-D-xylulose-5-phosphate reductoisomerase [Desulfobacterales bacterium]|nr:1-deoxy-D-xylulose-5-phosphate reductoisomerase [Desulfobacterales bacterium]